MRIKLMQMKYNMRNYIGRIFSSNKNLPVIEKIIKDVYYDIENDKKRSMDIYVPNEGEKFSVLIFIHGGGWVTGDKEDFTRTSRIMAYKGYLVFNVNYRLAPGDIYPAQINDVAKAISWVQINAAQYGGDASKIFLAGDCAGAHLVSHYTTILTNEKLSENIKMEDLIPAETIKGILLFYGVYDLKSLDKMNSSAAREQSKSFLGNDQELYAERIDFVSPLHYINESFPPVFLCAGESDDFYMQTIYLIQELRNNKVPHKFISFSFDEYPNARHGFLMDYKRRCTKKALESAGHFIDYYSNRNFNTTSYL